jgi:hypothetical protein
MSLEAADNSNTVVPVSLPTQSNSEMMRMEFGAFMMVETANYRELATRLDELGSELNEASRQLSLAASTEERLRQRVNDVEQTNASYAARLTQLTDEVANLKAIVAQRDTQIKSHEKEQRRLKEENRLLETRVAELNNQVQHLKKAVDYFRLTDDDVQLRIAAANVEKYLLQMIDPTYEFLDTLSNKWPALGTLGYDGANGTAPHHDGGDGKNDGDARVRLMQNGTLADSAKTPSAQYTPSGKKSMVMEGEIASSSEDFDDGSAAYVFVGAEHVYKAYSAARGSSLAVQAANEVRAHQLLALHAPSAVMPVLDVAMDVSYYSPQYRCLMCYYPAVVITTPRANGVQVDWSTVDGGELAVRGEQLLVAVSDMTACGVVHCDIKPSNLVVHDGIVRLIDFGLSYPFDVRTGRSPLVVPCGTPRYVAPEVERAREEGRMMKVTPAVDVFSVGRVLRKAASVVERCAPLRRLIERMTAVAPEERPSMRAALAEWRTSVAPALVEQQAMEVARAATRRWPARAGSTAGLRFPQRVEAFRRRLVGDRFVDGVDDARSALLLRLGLVAKQLVQLRKWVLRQRSLSTTRVDTRKRALRRCAGRARCPATTATATATATTTTSSRHLALA